MNTALLQQICRQFRGRLRRLVLQLTVCRLLVAALVLLGAAIAVDWWFRWSAPGRWTLLACLVVAIVTGAVVQLRLGRRRWTDLEVLTYLDSADRESHDSLVSLYEMANPEQIGETVTVEGRQMLELAVSRLGPAAQHAGLENVFQYEGLRRWRRWALAVVIMAAAAGGIFHSRASIALQRIFLPWSAVKWPTMTTLEVQQPSAGWRIPQGEDFEVVTTVSGMRPLELEMFYRSRSADYWIADHVPVDASGRASYTFKAVSEAVTFYLRGGDDRTERLKLDIIERPRLRKIVAWYSYPPYAGLANRRIESGQLRGLEGTEVKLDFETSVPIASATFALDGGAEESLPLAGPTSFSKTVQLRQDGQYVIKLTDPQGFREFKPERYDIQVTPDNPPEVRLLAPGRDVVATPQANLRFAFEARDDFGLRQVAFMHAILPSGKPEALSDKITGPIVQTGKESRAEFTWDFAKMELAHNAEVEYWVRAVDCNPTGRGVSESPHFKISLLSPTDFHNQILYEAKKVLAEARIAYRNQKKAYWNGVDWAGAAAAGKASEEQWNQIVELQEAAGRANEAVQRWMAELKQHIERNRMQDALMENRLAGIEDLCRGAAEQMAAAQGLLNAAHPKNSAEAQPDRLLQMRLEALKLAGDRQKLAAVGFGRMLRKLYDWENLQTALVNTSLLRERQAEIHETTRQMAPSTIGREAQDLDEKTLDKVLTLSQQQKAALEAETNLENQLAAIALKAEADGRATVKHYLLVAYGYLRGIQVNNTLKVIAAKIADNQLSDVAKDQAAVMSALKVVEGGLVAAGKNVGGEEAVAVADLLTRDKEDVEVARVEQPTTPEVAEEGAAVVNEAAVKKLLDEVVPMGDDALTQSLMALAEEQDDVRSRVAYLAGTLSAQDMPRYKQLKMAMLQYRQKEILGLANDKVQPLVEKSAYADRMKPWFGVILEQVQGLDGLLQSGNLSEATRRLQEDVIEASRDMAQFMARQKRIRDQAAEHAKKGDMDDFGRPYVLKGDDLAKTLGLYEMLDWARTVHAGVGRKTQWLLAQKEKPDVHESLSGKVNQQAGAWEELVARAMAVAKTGIAALSGDVKEQANRTGVGDLPGQALIEITQKVRAGGIDRSVLAGQEQAQEKMREVLGRIKELVDERVAVTAKPAAPESPEIAPTPAKEPGTAPAQTTFYSEEDLARQTTPEAIKSSLEKTNRLPPEISQRMLKELPKEFPEKYRRLIGAYYRDLLENKPETQKGAGKP